MAVDPDALETFQPQIDELLRRVELLESRPVGVHLADEAMLDLSASLSTQLNATNDDAERANIIQRAIDALA